MKEEILVFTDGTEDSLKLIDAGSKLGGAVSALIVGEADLSSYPVNNVYTIDDNGISDYDTAMYAHAIADAVKSISPSVFMFAANDRGRDLAPRTAARLDAGITSDVTEMALEDGKLLARKAGDKKGEIVVIGTDTLPQMVTVRPEAFDLPEKGHMKGEAVKTGIALDPAFKKTDTVGTGVAEKKSSSIASADIIVAGGRGLGGPEGFKLLREFADRIGGEVACSAACVDQGWIDHSYLIGQTGLMVRPKIYFACGISGSIQHMAGAGGSDIIVAINKDRDAQVFDYADYKIVGDLYEVIPELIKAWPI